MFNTLLQGKPTLWESDAWGARLGGAMLLEQDAATARAYTCEPQEMAEYAQAVFANTDAVLSGLTDADLDREINLVALGFPQNIPMGVFLTQMLLGNAYAHTGEISSWKGTMAMKSYPF